MRRVFSEKTAGMVFLVVMVGVGKASPVFWFQGNILNGTPTRPTAVVQGSPDALGFQARAFWEAHPHWAIGLGWEQIRFSDDGSLRFWTGVGELLFRGTTTYGGRKPYVQVSAGFEALPDKNQHWPGKQRYQFAVGDRISLAPTLFLDISTAYSWWEPKPNQFQSAQVQIGLLWRASAGTPGKENLKKQPEEKKELPSATPTATWTRTFSGPSPTPTISFDEDVAEVVRETPTPTSTPTPTATEALPAVKTQKSLQSMREVYEEGITAFKRKEWRSAEKKLLEALAIEDQNTPFWYYAEAHAMVSVIYLKYLPDREKARKHAEAALAIDPDTRTAVKVLRLLERGN